MEMRKVGPKPLKSEVSDRLLDLLSTDDDFRDLFVRDVNAALEIAGYVHADPTEAGPGQCLVVSKLASKESIARDREKIKADLSIPFGFIGTMGLRG